MSAAAPVEAAEEAALVDEEPPDPPADVDVAEAEVEAGPVECDEPVVEPEEWIVALLMVVFLLIGIPVPSDALAWVDVVAGAVRLASDEL